MKWRDTLVSIAAELTGIAPQIAARLLTVANHIPREW